jgi:hypothetical protein
VVEFQSPLLKSSGPSPLKAFLAALAFLSVVPGMQYGTKGKERRGGKFEQVGPPSNVTCSEKYSG